MAQPDARPNMADPPSLLLVDAARHLLPVRPVAFALVLVAAAGVVAGILGVGSLVPFALGLIISFSLILAAYLCWYAWFCKRNEELSPACPGCLLRMWQVVCGHCGRDLPPLSLWLWGFLLPNCPSCGARLSGGDAALARSTCHHEVRIPSPRKFYSKKMHLIVWVDDEVPDRQEWNKWKRAAGPTAGRLLLYRTDHEDASAAMVFTRDYQNPGALISPAYALRTRLVLISKDVQEPWLSQIQGLFPPTTLFERVTPIRDLMRGDL